MTIVDAVPVSVCARAFSELVLCLRPELRFLQLQYCAQVMSAIEDHLERHPYARSV